MGTRTATAEFILKALGKASNQLDANKTGTPGGDLGDTLSMIFATGTADGQIDRIISSKSRAITTGNNEDIDLFDLAGFDMGAGAGLDALGQAAGFAKIDGIFIRNQSGSAGTLVFGGEGSAAAWSSLFSADTETLSLPPDTAMLIGGKGAGYAVADTTNHLLRIAASGGDIIYDLHIFGRSA